MARIEHVAVFAGNLDALKVFYVEALGLRVLVDNSAASPPGYFLGDDAGMAMEIIQRPEGEPPVNQRYVCHVAFTVDDVTSARVGLERRGIRFETDTAVDNESMRTRFFLDPEGNRCQIISRSRPLGSA
jgi:glyoxylase I family protein